MDASPLSSQPSLWLDRLACPGLTFYFHDGARIHNLNSFNITEFFSYLFTYRVFTLERLKVS